MPGLLVRDASLGRHGRFLTFHPKGAFVDREVETKGRDFYDEQKAKREAKEEGKGGLRGILQ